MIDPHLSFECPLDCPQCAAEEQWAQILQAPKYEVSTLGRVRNIKTQKVLKMQYNDLGYSYMPLRAFGKKKSFRVNRLVLIAFRGFSPVAERDECAHLNGVRDDNRLLNLEWKTHSENYQDRQRHGTCNAGERNGRAVLTDEDRYVMRNLYANGMTRSKLEKRFNVSERTVRRIVLGARAR